MESLLTVVMGLEVTTEGIRTGTGTERWRERVRDLGPDLQNILRQSYDHLTIMAKLRSTYDTRPVDKISYEERKAFLSYDSLAKL